MTRRTSRKPVRRNSRQRTSRGLRRNSSTYYSVHIPFSKTPTEWHPTSSTGPFAVLSRGKFSTVQQAHDWAQEHLGYKPVYKVVPHTLHENSRARYTRAWRQIGGSHRDPADQGTNPEGLTWNEWRAAARTGGLHTAKLIAAWRAGEDPIEHRDLRRNGKALTAAMADEIVAHEYRPIDHAFASQKLSAPARARGFKTPTGCDICNLPRGEHPSARDAAAIAAAIARAHGRLNRNPRRRRSRGRR
jgi:hypothetical protein